LVSARSLGADLAGVFFRLLLFEFLMEAIIQGRIAAHRYPQPDDAVLVSGCQKPAVPAESNVLGVVDCGGLMNQSEARISRI
jgi:hypothetical protein